MMEQSQEFLLKRSAKSRIEALETQRNELLALVRTVSLWGVAVIPDPEHYQQTIRRARRAVRAVDADQS